MKSRTALLLVAIAGGMVAFFGNDEANSQDAQAQVRSERVQALLVERRDTLRTVCEMLTELVPQSRAMPEELIPAQEALLQAELELAATDQERVKLYQQRVENYRKLEQIMAARVEAAKATKVSLLEARAKRLAAEVDLEQAKEGGA